MSPETRELYETRALLWQTLAILDVIIHDTATSTLRGRTLRELTREAFEEALRLTHENQSQAADLLGISRQAVYHYIKSGRKTPRLVLPTRSKAS